MKRRNTRLIAGIFAAAVMLGAIAGCGQGSEPEPTTDIQATIDAAVRAATPTETPISEPTATTEPTVAPTPDLAATVAAMVAAADQPTAMAATPTPETQPEPTAMPAEPTAPVDPTATPIPAVPTDTPSPTATPSSGRPCFIAGTVTVGNVAPAEGTPVFAKSQTENITVEGTTTADGKYVLVISHFGMVFDLFVGDADSGMDTPTTFSGCREIRNLSVTG